ncbi:MAG: hypothetical protein AAB622_00675 [Patescibacteria group bacterium]
MMRTIRTSILFLFLLIIFLSPKKVLAEGNNQFVTIVNPVRIAYYTKDVSENIKAQYKIISENNLPATWLLTYDALSNPNVVRTIKSMDQKQEIGIFLEVTSGFSSAANVTYNESGSWHHATSVFLSGYTQEERIRFIDTVFGKFKKEFGYYPTSVGSWWTDSFSLSYMEEKYGITANLTCADQFSTDGYQIWGQYWSTPFYPSKMHAGIPAGKNEDKIGIVTLQWAARDPDLGYQSSLYSTQDYFTKPNKDILYFKKLLDLYAGSKDSGFGQITVGLEGDLTPDAYNGIFRDQILAVSKSGYQVTTMRDFADWYKETFSDLSPPKKIDSDNAIWYQSPWYRVGIIDGKMVDLRRYTDFPEPYYQSPNKENTLFINTPSVFDQMSNPNEVWDLEGVNVEFYPTYFEINSKEIKIPDLLKKSTYFKISRTPEGYRVDIKPVDTNHLEFKDWTIETIHNFKSKRFWLNILIGKGWDQFKKTSYWVSAEELIALRYLATLPNGKVLVYDHECIQCEYHSLYKPAVFANRRDYVSKITNKSIVYNSSIFEGQDRAITKKELEKTKTKYIYLVKHENYIEKIPFSPGDLGVEKILENANSVIWEVVK